MAPITLDRPQECAGSQAAIGPGVVVAGAGGNGGTPPAAVQQPSGSRALAAAKRAQQRLTAQKLVRHEELDEKLQSLSDEE